MAAQPRQQMATSRTFALVGHRSCGKTSLGDLLLAAAGVTRQVGRVDEGSSLLDFSSEAKRRRLTLASSFAWLDWQDTTLHLVDTPGSEGLAHEQSLMLSAVDAALVVVSAVDGVQVGTRRALDEITRIGMPKLIAITRMDRPCDADSVVADLVAVVGEGVKVVPIQVPIHGEGRFVGVIDLLHQRMLNWSDAGECTTALIPESYAEIVASAWERIVEAVALSNDVLLERYLEDLTLDPADVRVHLAAAVAAGKIVPVCFTAPAAGIGAHPVLDAIVSLLPSPWQRRGPWAVDEDGHDVRIEPDGSFVAQLLATRIDDEGKRYHVLRVWSGEPPRKGEWTHGESGRGVRVHKLYALRGPRASTAKNCGAGSVIATWESLLGRPGDTFTDGSRRVLGAPPAPAPMLSWTLAAEDKVSTERLADALQTLLSLDPALEVYTCELTLQPILAGVGQDQLDRAVDWLRERLGVKVRTSLPAVGYRETPVLSVDAATGTHKRVSDGLVAEFGECTLSFEPRPADEGVWMVAHVDEEQVPEKFFPAIERGVLRACQHGPTAGYPVVGVGVHCIGGAYDMFESTDEHFEQAGEKAMKLALDRAGSRLLEPWWRIQVRGAPEDIGVILAELGSRRARITGLEVDGKETAVFADCPYREMRTLAPRLQSLTGGHGRFTGHPSHFDAVPPTLVKDAVANSPFLRMI